jgi:hypothetical protein
MLKINFIRNAKIENDPLSFLEEMNNPENKQFYASFDVNNFHREVYFNTNDELVAVINETIDHAITALEHTKIDLLKKVENFNNITIG